ncbi:MAG: hypothetical protein P1S60_14120 [Anaerolineae bacterium]|nr:hypothetical protein [Anaerolineae bacterium]
MAAPVLLVLTAFLQTIVLSYAVLRTGRHGWRLFVALFMAFYGISTLMVAVEAVYLPDTLPLDIVLPLLVNGGMTAALFSGVAVLVWGRGHLQAVTPDKGVSVSWAPWTGKFVLIGVSWTILFVVFGALVFLPLAEMLAPEALAVYTNLDMPAWVLPFQLVRGMLWAALVLPLLLLMRGSRWATALTTGLLFAVPMGTNLLRATSLPIGLLLAHPVEVLGENFIFGWLVARILVGKRQSMRQPEEIMFTVPSPEIQL